MMKKIGAVLLALVLCLSVAVLPVAAGFDSGYTLASGKSIAYKIELDKTSYKAGETVTVKLFMRMADADQLNGAAVTFAVNSDLFDLTENAADTVKTTATLSDNAATLFKVPTEYQWAWVSGTALSRLIAANTEAENTLYDSYLKFSFARDMNGAHENANVTTKGLPAEEINADEQPIIQFQLKLKDNGIADGTPVNVAITSGTINGKPAQATASVFVNGATRASNMAATGFDVSAAVASATVGEDAPAAPVLTKGKAQYKMETLVPGVSVADKFQYRVLSTISKADWEANFANTGAEDATTNALTEVGFIAADTATFDLDTAKAAVIANTTGDYTTGLPAGYKAATTIHVQRADGDATFACRVDTSKDTCADLSYIAFAKYLDADGQPQVMFYDAAATVLLKTDYQTLVDRWLGQ